MQWRKVGLAAHVLASTSRGFRHIQGRFGDSRPTTRLRWFKAFSSPSDNLYVPASRQAEAWEGPSNPT